MGMPSININFQSVGISAIQRSEKGVVAMVLEDAKYPGALELTSANEIPADMSQVSREQLRLAFLGYVNPPRKVIAYVINPGEDEEGNPTGETLADALRFFETQSFDYLVGPAGLDADGTEDIASWVKSERGKNHTVKAVLPNVKEKHEGIVNFVTDGIRAGETAYTTAQYCARMAGLIAGTPMTISATYAPLPELSDVERLTKEDMDKAVDRGEFLLFHDGVKVKTGRAVNSLTTITDQKGEAFKKIKIVEAMDLIQNDIRLTAQDSYIGKYSNSYDNKCLLMMAIKGYLEELERGGILESGTSVVEIDLEAQEGYLKSNGIDTSVMSEQDIKEAQTGSKVFLKASIRILDAIEDIDLNIVI